VIVAHSMGGLVFKQAFIRGEINEEYRHITSNIKAVLFLATPHRGTDLAETLNKILSGSFFGHSPKEYVNELTKNSPTIEELNEQFRHHSAKLRIFSFYETLSTSIGRLSMMVLEKHSSVLGYSHETPQPLVANHHDVCKFSSPEDPNYKSVSGALRSVVKFLTLSSTDGEDLDVLKKWLGVISLPENDLAAVRSVRKAGTCEHILEKPEFGSWLESSGPRILWAHAPPGNGKSCQCSFVIDHLKERQSKCVYWLFKYGDAEKRSLACMFRSVAYQIACEDIAFRNALISLADSGIRKFLRD